LFCYISVKYIKGHFSKLKKNKAKSQISLMNSFSLFSRLSGSFPRRAMKTKILAANTNPSGDQYELF
jgi:hypothetical protein